jgi:hypothetical protein
VKQAAGERALHSAVASERLAGAGSKCHTSFSDFVSATTVDFWIAEDSAPLADAAVARSAGWRLSRNGVLTSWKNTDAPRWARTADNPVRR